jgi:hypothetical protein
MQRPVFANQIPIEYVKTEQCFFRGENYFDLFMLTYG